MFEQWFVLFENCNGLPRARALRYPLEEAQAASSSSRAVSTVQLPCEVGVAEPAANAVRYLCALPTLTVIRTNVNVSQSLPQHFRSSKFLLAFSSPTTPETTLEHDMETGLTTALQSYQVSPIYRLEVVSIAAHAVCCRCRFEGRAWWTSCAVDCTRRSPRLQLVRAQAIKFLSRYLMIEGKAVAQPLQYQQSPSSL